MSEGCDNNASMITHQDLGRDLELFMFHETTPGSCFFLPHGTRVYNALVDMLRVEYFKRGYDEVNSPNIYNAKLWIKSGHWQHYKDNMFIFNIKDEGEGEDENNISQTFSNKPMNCPGHCLIYKHRVRSYKDLPLRLAEFGVLHRNELTGSLRGLTRVRKFVQDDAHIFCRLDQVQEEIIGCLDFLKYVYGKLGFTSYRVTLSTKPDKYMGEAHLWEIAQNNLKHALDFEKIPFDINDKDGAFYGPKIDIMVKDSLEREHQCGTIQLDFQLPDESRFDLLYTDEDGSKQHPVIIHRAILGSVERMFAILLEHGGGRFPSWCSPRHVLIVQVKPTVQEYCKKVCTQLKAHALYVDIEASKDTLNYKIRYGETMKYNHILVIGEREQNNGTVNRREGKKNTEMALVDFLSEYFL